MKSVYFTLAFGLVLPAVDVTVAFAQAAPAGGAPAPAGGGAAPAGGGAPAGATQSVPGPTVYQTFPGGVAPTPPGQPLGGGNIQYSSSQPITGNQEDSFDFKHGGGGGSVHGAENGSFVLGGGGPTGVVPGTHLVHRGDTLWAICDSYFHNPYQWPRIWSYNPQIQNPHWIYPGDQVRLRGGGDVAASPVAQGSGLVDKRRQVPADTIFLRNSGFIEDDTDNIWGEVNGSPEDKMFLTDFDEVYLRVSSAHDVKVGQELTVFRTIKSVSGGKLIEINGTVRVDQWNPKEHIARARVTEALDPIERGASIGPVTRRFEVVPPLRNEVDRDATILTSVRPNILFGQNQIVFIDKGEEQGLKPGNRLLVLKKGDAWHDSLTTKSSAIRIATEEDRAAAIESVPRPRHDDVLPEEVQAELRVISVKKNTAMCIVTNSHRELEAGDKAYARKGY